MSRKATEINPIRAERVKTLIKREKITQTKLSEMLFRSQQNISAIVKAKIALTEDTAKQIIKLFPAYRLQWLLGYDDIMLHTEELKQMINRKADTAEAINEVIRLVADEICAREKIKRPTIPFLYDFSILQTQLHDYAELIISDYLKNRENSHFWKRMDHEYHMNRRENDETGKR